MVRSAPAFAVLPLLCISACCYAAGGLLPGPDVNALLLANAQYASIASGSEKLLSESPAVISVITAENLANHGITSLEQALEEVPGVYSPYRFLNGHFVFRGIRSQLFNNPEVLLLVDGLPQNDVVNGIHQRFITRIPIGNIRRIEIIRGAGSAYYGADAYAGVINIVTRTDKDYDDSELRARGGSYDTAEVDGIFKQTLGDITALLSVQGRTTDGHRPLITADAQSYFDKVFGTSASLAPGEAETWFKESNLSLDLFTTHWRTRLQARDHHLGMGTSLFSSLSEGGEGSAQAYNLDVFYNNPHWSDDWSIKANAGLLDEALDADKPFLPDGAFNQFPDGIKSYAIAKERHALLDLKAFYRGNSHHESMIGGGFFYAKVYKSDELNNYIVLPGGAVVPKGSYTTVPEDQRMFQLKSRQVKYLTFHDDWNYTHDYILSVGARYDYYSDFGGTFNPRIALIWLTRQDITAKLIANRAFRAPTLVELYSKNAAEIGDPELGPSLINTQELVVEKRFISDARLQWTVFRHVISDSIQVLPDSIGNLITINSQHDIVGKGSEIELSIPVTRRVHLNSSYSYQINTSEGDPSYTTYSASPHHKLYAGIDWQFRSNWNLYSNVLWVNKFTRDINDPRDDLGDDAFFGAVLRYKSPGKRWESWLSVRNIFDRQAVVPSDDYRFLPNDIPLPGTNFIAEFLYRI